MRKLFECNEVRYDVNRRERIRTRTGGFGNLENCDEKTREELLSILSQLEPYLSNRIPLNLD
jgi:hypothetical protein